MSGCELIQCPYYIEKKCTEPFDYVNKDTGEDMCSRNSSAIPREEYKKSLSPIDSLKQQRYLLQEELYKAVEMYGNRTHPNVLAISAELDQICLQLQKMGEVANA
jgi:hypothetical protein